MRYAEKVVLHGITRNFAAGEFITIAGPNGAGQSTLLGIMSGLLPGYMGFCKLHDREVRSWPRRDFARQVSVVLQSLRIDFGFTVEQVVLMGRNPFAGSLFESDEDHRQVERAMELTGTTEFRHRDIRTLSG